MKIYMYSKGIKVKWRVIGLFRYVIKRVLSAIITVWIVITITFFLMRLMPGGPFDGDKINYLYFFIIIIQDLCFIKLIKMKT